MSEIYELEEVLEQLEDAEKGFSITDDNTAVIYQAYTKNETDALLSQKADLSYISTLLSTIYPVGSIYIGTQSTCPLATLISGSTWALVATDKALWGGDGTNANTTIAAGLPNITGSIFGIGGGGYNSSGAFTNSATSSAGWGNGSGNNTFKFSIDASRSSAIYGNSTTFQPPAYRVNIWRRTA